MRAPEQEGAPERAASGSTRNRFDLMEFAGAFGDLGTLIPFVIAYVGVAKVDPMGLLFAFGVALIACGVWYRTPFPVQPMKAIGAVAAIQAAKTAVITPAAIYAAGLATGAIWLVLGLTGLAAKVTQLVARPVVTGIILGLGMGFMLEGVKMMVGDWVVAVIAFTGTLLLLTNRRIPAMLLLLVFGIACGLLRHPHMLDALAGISARLSLPSFALSHLSWSDLWVGVAFLALPQLPLTLGNAVIAVREENNRLFPDRPVTDKTVAVSTGLMNLFGASVGGVPMCHGAGGMAGHVAFGARTGGAPILLGGILLVLALFFSDSVSLLFNLLPRSVLGVVLVLTGAQLALGACDFSRHKGERLVTVVTAACAMWNVGVAFLAGIALSHLERRGWLRL